MSVDTLQSSFVIYFDFYHISISFKLYLSRELYLSKVLGQKHRLLGAQLSILV